MEKTVFICEDTLEGIFTGIYDAYASRIGHDKCELAAGDVPLEMFCDYIQVLPSKEKAEKVIRTLKKQFGEERFYDLYYVLCSNREDKADVVYKTVVVGLSNDLHQNLLDHLSNPYVARAFEIRRNVANEVMHIREFIRFQELENGLLLSKITPQNNILPFLMPHFADRFPLENFMIYDENRKLAGLHQSRHNWCLAQTEGLNPKLSSSRSEQERFYGDLFRLFCKTIAIKPRENLNLQRQMLPLRFRNNMTEFQ